jgi:hypothetical protein
MLSALLAVVACALVLGATLANGRTAATTAPASGKATQATQVKSAQPANKNRRHATHRVNRARHASTVAGKADPTPGTDDESNTESESGADPETGQPGEPAAGQGHQDLLPNGQEDPNAQHECTGDCVE